MVIIVKENWLDNNVFKMNNAEQIVIVNKINEFKEQTKDKNEINKYCVKIIWVVQKNYKNE